mmetsp:Transcript_90178/g.156279  ORF Transcript_90178/g.156279 Transcript_90178/m.156279 type:complete len:473 (+) Transcript_90178:3-1421(+)
MSNATSGRTPILTESEIEDLARKACRLRACLEKDPEFDQVEKNVDLCNGEDKGEEYYNHLQELCEIRTRSDRFYVERAFPLAEERRKIEGLPTVDKFRRAGDFDGEFRQRGPDGKSFVAPIEVSSQPKSLYLQQLNERIEQAGALGQIDIEVKDAFWFIDEESLGDHAKEEALLRALQMRFPVSDYDTGFSKMMVNLGMQLVKLQRQGQIFLAAQNLWWTIVQRTDELYQVAEDLLEPYKLAVYKLLEMADLDANSFTLCPFKDPVRIYEKASDDYSKGPRDLEDGVIPEAWVADVIRGSIVVEDPLKMIMLQELLLHENALQNALWLLGGEEQDIKVQLVRLKNRFSARQKIPTHFRFMLNNIMITKGPLSMICELQVHHRHILEEDSKLNSHSYYNYFRTFQKDQNKDRYLQQEKTATFSDNHDDWDVRLEARIHAHQMMLKNFYWEKVNWSLENNPELRKNLAKRLNTR